MKSLVAIIPLFIMVCFVSCDGRDRMHKTPKEVLQENKLLDSFSEKITYFPEVYNEIITDTVLSNGYQIHIKNYIDMNHAILKTTTVDSISHKKYFRSSMAEVRISDQNNIIFKDVIDKAFFLELDPSLKSFFEQATLDDVWLDEANSTISDKIILRALFCKPTTTVCVFYKIIIDRDGQYTLEEYEGD